MPSAARCIPLLLSLALGAGVAAPVAAQESGFFSRFIPSFGAAPAAPPAAATKPAPAAAKPAPAAAAEIPSGPTEANPFNGGSGGLINAMRGAPSGACDGIVCSLVGGETAARPPGAPGPAAPESAGQAATMASARSRPVDDRVSPRKERCTAPANDPWRCYR